jgi:hypothetical protein
MVRLTPKNITNSQQGLHKDTQLTFIKYWQLPFKKTKKRKKNVSEQGKLREGEKLVPLNEEK